MNAGNTAGSTSEPTVDELGARIMGLSARLGSATCRWLLMIAEFDRREGYLPAGLPSTSRWLSHHCGIAHRTAVEHVRVARSLAEFPPLAAEMSEGRLSYSQVRAISRVPSKGEHEVVADLIELAEHGCPTRDGGPRDAQCRAQREGRADPGRVSAIGMDARVTPHDQRATRTGARCARRPRY